MTLCRLSEEFNLPYSALVYALDFAILLALKTLCVVKVSVTFSMTVEVLDCYRNYKSSLWYFSLFYYFLLISKVITSSKSILGLFFCGPGIRTLWLIPFQPGPPRIPVVLRTLYSRFSVFIVCLLIYIFYWRGSTLPFNYHSLWVQYKSSLSLAHRQLKFSLLSFYPLSNFCFDYNYDFIKNSCWSIMMPLNVDPRSMPFNISVLPNAFC